MAAAFASWTPAPGTWPLRRYDPANTAHNPTATPPRETPTPRELASVSTSAKRPRVLPVVGSDHVALYGTGLTVYPRGGGETVRAADAPTPLAGFGADGRLHTVRQPAGDSDPPAAVVGYDAADSREAYRVRLDTDGPTGLTVGAREVYVGTENGTLRAVAPGRGRRWRVDGAMPALVDGRLYATDAPLDGTVAYARRTGLGRHLRAEPERRWSAGPVDGFPRAPAVADGRLVLGSDAEGGGVVAAFDAASGDRLWEPRALGRNVATPAVVGDRGYVAAAVTERRGLVAALDLTTGETLWRDDVEWQATVPTASDDTLRRRRRDAG
ncbi:MAG: PQQ-binding-like beta-propeller repeat protein [Haloplanus sp.]